MPHKRVVSACFPSSYPAELTRQRIPQRIRLFIAVGALILPLSRILMLKLSSDF